MENAPRAVELLSPAKDLACGIEAVNHGADAVYIGAPKFSARAAAANSIDDIHRLCDYAHPFGVKIYAALNTILKEEELPEAERLIRQLHQAGTDAIIIQDMGITQLDIPPVPLHASTQADNRTPEKVKFLESAGFSQVVLARELSINQIRHIAEQTTVALEVFVHGALCTSYSGQCYLSAAMTGRSANRGDCAQCCRLPYTLTDANGKVIIRDKYLLSLKDINRSGDLEALLDAGVSSFKIEGRLKDVFYVKNITAWYRQKLDAILARRPEYRRSSLGRSSFTFEPAPEKSFFRGFNTPKSTGEPIGVVKEQKKNFFTIDGLKPLNNGDGLVFFNRQGEPEGFRVNRVEGIRIFPATMPELLPSTPLFRNYDHAFEKQLSKPSAERKISVAITFTDTPSGFALAMADEAGGSVVVEEAFQKEQAVGSQEANIRRQLSKLGNTPFEASAVRLDMSDKWFVPSSLLSEMRRKGVERLLDVRNGLHRLAAGRRETPPSLLPFPEQALTYLGNVSNSRAEAFYRACRVASIEPAFELSPRAGVPLMFTRHCLRRSMGWCPSLQKQESPYQEPLYLLHKNTRLKLQFDCANCLMLISSLA